MKTPRHAILIMAHNQPELLKKLLHVLDDERNDLYLHIDKKAAGMGEEMFAGTVHRAGLFMLGRQSIIWGGESLIRCELELFRAAAERKYAYFHLISGVDFPTCSQNDMHAFFEKHNGYEFIDYWDRPEKDFLYRIRYRYPLQEQIGRYTNDLPTVVRRFRSKALVLSQIIKGNDRVRDYGKEIRGGSNWVSVTDAFVRYLLDRQDEIEQVFMQGVAADELYKQTICWNSPFREKIWPGGNMRLIDWERGDPYTWKESDLEEIVHSGAIFVRKLSGEDRLADLLIKYSEGEDDHVS